LRGGVRRGFAVSKVAQGVETTWVTALPGVAASILLCAHPTGAFKGVAMSLAK